MLGAGWAELASTFVTSVAGVITFMILLSHISSERGQA